VVALDLIVENSQELYDSLLGKRIKLAISAEADRAQVSCDVTQLQQVITNLLVNAKEAVSRREDPRVSLSTTTVRLRSGEVDPELAPGSYVRLDVTDNGVGLTPEAVGRCFEPFFTTKSVDPATGVGISGAGLGLASAYSIIKQHAGLLTVHSIEGEGATFSIYLPVVVEDETQGQKKTAQEDDRRVEASQVFMLGWEAGEKPFVSSIFESFGYKPRSAYDVRQLRELLSQGPTPSAMLILDLDTCSASVLKECQQLLHELPELSIVGAVSGRSARCDGVFPPARFELLEKPLGVWGVERILKRFAQSASPL
jgi:hypothetical protein